MDSYHPLDALLQKFEHTSDTLSPHRNANTPVYRINVVLPTTSCHNVPSCSNEVVPDSNENPMIPTTSSCPMLLRKDIKRSESTLSYNNVPLPIHRRRKVKEENPPTPTENITTPVRFDPFAAIRDRNRQRHAPVTRLPTGCQRMNKTYGGQRQIPPLDNLLSKFDHLSETASPIGNNYISAIPDNVAPNTPHDLVNPSSNEVVEDSNENLIIPSTRACHLMPRGNINRSEPPLQSVSDTRSVQRRRKTVQKRPQTPAKPIASPRNSDPFDSLKERNQPRQSTIATTAAKCHRMNKTYGGRRAIPPLDDLLLKIDQLSDTASPVYINTPIIRNNVFPPSTSHIDATTSSNEVVLELHEKRIPDSCSMSGTVNRNKWPVQADVPPALRPRMTIQERAPTLATTKATPNKFDPFDALRAKNLLQQSSFASPATECARRSKTFVGQRSIPSLNDLLLKFDHFSDTSSPICNINTPMNRNDVVPQATSRDDVIFGSETDATSAAIYQPVNKTFNMEHPSTSFVANAHYSASLEPSTALKSPRSRREPLAHSTPRLLKQDGRSLDNRVEYQLKQSEIPQDLHRATVEMVKRLFF